MEYLHHRDRLFQHWLSAPFIYSVIVPLVFLDISMEIYHRICFPLYGLPYVRRDKYVFIDRGRLSYLHWLQKINCMYCGYANGLLRYASEIAHQTEIYWCAILHENQPKTKEFKDYLPYGDEKAFKKFSSEKKETRR